MNLVLRFMSRRRVDLKENEATINSIVKKAQPINIFETGLIKPITKDLELQMNVSNHFNCKPI
jgi:hypothetical protein